MSRRERAGHGEVEVTDPPAAEGLPSKIK